MGSDKQFAQAQHSVIDPLIELEPSQETGLNSHFRSSFAPAQNPPSPPVSTGLKSSDPANIRHQHTGSSNGSTPFVRHQHTGSSVETNPYRRSRNSPVSKGSPAISHVETTPHRSHDYPSPPNSASPRRERFSDHRSQAFGSMNQGRPRRSSQPSASNSFRDESSSRPPLASNPFKDGGLSRGGSLRERYPGDLSNRPLDVIRKDVTKAHRAHHLRKKNFQGADTIDRLDRTGFSYHHEGPYDAANMARNRDVLHSPVAAVRDTNEEALRATPRENIIDAVVRHRPLEGVAIIPPGMEDRFGRVLDYEEGADLMREPGADYKRWPGQEYLPGDLKGKGEPAYSMDQARKDRKKYGDEGTEMKTHRRYQSLDASHAPGSTPAKSLHEDDNTRNGHGNSTGNSMGSALKKRLGSIRRRRTDT